MNEVNAACTCDPGLPEGVTNAQCPQHGILAFMASGGAGMPSDDPLDWHGGESFPEDDPLTMRLLEAHALLAGSAVNGHPVSEGGARVRAMEKIEQALKIRRAEPLPQRRSD